MVVCVSYRIIVLEGTNKVMKSNPPKMESDNILKHGLNNLRTIWLLYYIVWHSLTFVANQLTMQVSNSVLKISKQLHTRWSQHPCQQ